MKFAPRALIGRAAVTAACLALGLLTAGRILGADDPAAAKAKEAERQKWEQKVVFYGEEDTGEFSIRILDKATTETADFKYFSLWKYDLDQKKWVKVDDNQQSIHIVMPKDKPKDSPQDSQLLAKIPVTAEKVGQYYARWSVNDVSGATFCRIGPNFIGKSNLSGKIPEGMMLLDVPVDKNKAVRVIAPDPRTQTSDK